MAENLMARSVMSSSQVEGFLNDKINPIIGLPKMGEADEFAFLIRARRILVAAKEEAEEKERQAYDLLGIKDINALQKKLDELNGSGLNFLANSVLSKAPLLQKIKRSTITLDTIYDRVDEAFNNFLESPEGLEARERIGRNTILLFQEFERAILGFKRGTLI